MLQEAYGYQGFLADYRDMVIALICIILFLIIMPRETTSNGDFFSLRRLTKNAMGMPCVYTGSRGFDFILNC